MMKIKWFCLFLSIKLLSSEPDIALVLTPKGSPTLIESNKMIVQKFYDSFLAGDWNGLNDLLSSNYTIADADEMHSVGKTKFPEMGKDLKLRMQAYHKAFPQFSIRIEELMGEGNKIFARVSLTGIQKGPFLGINPMGKTIRFKFFTIFTITNGRITYMTDFWNEYSVMRQLGYFVL